MSMTFTKLFSSITASTIWAARDQTRIVWITMLAMADQHGRVWASIPGLANIARVSIEDCETALAELSGPDKYSRTKDFDGRRIEDIDGGWRLLNHAKYRAIRDEESIKESKRRYINAKRAEQRSTVDRCRTESNSVDLCRANTEAEAEAEATIPSVPDGTDAAAASPTEEPKPQRPKPKGPEDLAKADLWRASVSVLEQGGCPKAQCRTFMGKLAGDYPFDVLQKAVAQAVSAQPADAREYLKATCQRLNGERKDPATVPSVEHAKTTALLAQYEAQGVAAKSPESIEARRRFIERQKGPMAHQTQGAA